MKKIAFTLAAILTTLSLFGCTSNNNQSTPPPVSPPMNEIYFASGEYVQRGDFYRLYFNFIYTGKDNLLFRNYRFEMNPYISNNATYYNGNREIVYIVPNTVITLSFIHDPKIHTMQIQFAQIDGSWILDEKSFNLDELIKTIPVTDSSSDSH